MTCKDQPPAELHQTFVGAREREATYLRLQTRVQLQVVDVAVQLARNSLLSPIARVDGVCVSTPLIRAASRTRQLTAISGSEFHSSKLSKVLRPRKVRNSFIVHTPHWRAWVMPKISTIRRAAGEPRARYAPATFSVASCRMLASSSSLKRPSGPRLSPAKVRVTGFGSTVAQELRTPWPKSLSSSLSSGLSPNAFLNMSSVHLMSFSAVVACHCDQDQ